MSEKLSLFSKEPESLYIAEFCEGSVSRRWPVGIMARAHRHNELEMNLALGGTATYLLNDRKYDLRRNTILWLFPGQDHIFMDRSPDFEMWLVIFKPEMVERVSTSPATRVLCERDPEGFFSRQLGDDQADELCAHFEKISAFAGDHALFNASLGYSLLLAWRMYQEADYIAGGSLHASVEAALRLMRNEHDTLSIPQIARQVGLSQPHLSRLFRAQTGLSLIEFRNRVRVERFRRLYGKGNRISMLRAALDSGFGSYPQFHRIFREVVGVSPQEHYRAGRAE
ncbi:MAG TPA: helix-turn-helix domain-containing protein [Capsulimonadaceae bacterium]|nr:helix-turn-helix domain-containing protein [Capsulimonadaceae bacterium]